MLGIVIFTALVSSGALAIANYIQSWSSEYLVLAYTLVGYWGLALSAIWCVGWIVPGMWREASENRRSRSKNSKSVGKVASVNSRADVAFKVILAILIVASVIQI